VEDSDEESSLQAKTKMLKTSMKITYFLFIIFLPLKKD
jgi:hypothetical protein